MHPELTGTASADRQLERRHEVEERFHDEAARHEEPPSRRMSIYDDLLDGRHLQMILDAAGNLQGKHVLDFGCGPGVTSRLYALKGAARVEGFDISGEKIRIAQRNVVRDGLGSRVFFRHLAAEQIDYPDESFDVVIGKAILHHTDLEITSHQLHRVLRPGGVACFLEPLSHNPFLNLFRRLTPSRRTPTERPLSMADLDIFRRCFDSVEYRGFYLLPLLSNGLLLLTGSKTLYLRSMAVLLRLDAPLLRHFPSLQKYCWTALLILRKGNSERGVPPTAS